MSNQPNEEIPLCCESVNEQRTELILAISQLTTLRDPQVDGLTSEGYRTYLDTVDQIKTLAFCVFDKLSKIDPDPECCAAAAEAIKNVTIQALVSIPGDLNPDVIAANFKLYKQYLKLILKSTKGDKSCCCKFLI